MRPGTLADHGASPYHPLMSHGTDLKERPNKSQLKRDMLALQRTAERLVALGGGVLARLEIDARLRSAIAEYGRVRGKPAQRRHLRYLTRLLIETPDSLRAIEDLIGEEDRQSASERARFKVLERWRDRLLAEGDVALAALIREYPGADAQQIRQLARAAQREQAQDSAPASARRLFRHLRSLAERGHQGPSEAVAEAADGPTPATAGRDTDMERLRWQCRRGLLELDLILEAFLDGGYAGLPVEDQAIFVRLLDTPDQVLLDWFMGQGSPENPGLRHGVDLVRSWLATR